MTEKTHAGHIAKVSFELIKTTPGALRYQEVDENGVHLKTDADGAIVGTLYLRKAKLDGRTPKRITFDLDEG